MTRGSGHCSRSGQSQVEAGDREGQGWAPHLQPWEDVHQGVLVQSVDDALVVMLHDLQLGVFLCVGGVEADQADDVGYCREDRCGQIDGLSIEGSQQIAEHTNFLTYWG